MASQHSAPARVSASRLAPPVARVLASASRRLAAVTRPAAAATAACQPVAAAVTAPRQPAASAAAAAATAACQPAATAACQPAVTATCQPAAFTSRQTAATITRCLLAAAALALAALMLAAAPAALADEEKVATPTVTLEVVETASDGTESLVSSTDSAVGEEVDFQATGTLPYDIDEFSSYYYSFHITIAESLVLDESSVTVTLVSEDGTTTDLTSAFTVTYEGGVLVVTCVDLLAAAEVSATDTVVVSYTCTLSEDAATTGTSGVATSYAYVEYTVSTESDATAVTVEDAADVYTWQLVISKLAADTSAALAGAVFTVQAEDGRYVSADGTLSTEAVALTTDDEGLISLSGLAAGTYTVTETAAPSGYAAVDAFTLVISADATSESPELAVSVSTSAVSITQVDTASGTVAIAITDPASTTATITEAVSKLTGSSSGSSGDDDDATASSGSDGTSSGSTGSSSASGSGGSSARTGDVVRGLLLALAIAAVAAAAAWALQRRRKQEDAR